ncbi:MAG: DUF4385 domain-containing protein [Rhodothermales bacterium]
MPALTPPSNLRPADLRPATQVEYDIDFKLHPELYRYTSDERGVFKVQPYKDELLPLWSFKTVEAAHASIEQLWAKYEQYRADEDFVGMDMTRKYLQMGFTRAMRYAKYPGGRKRNTDGTLREPQVWADPEKREAAVLFRQQLEALRADPRYLELKDAHLAQFNATHSPMPGR